MGFINNNATTLKQVKIGTDTSKIHYIKRNGSIEWAKPYNLTIVYDTEQKLKDAHLASQSVYRKTTKVSSGVTSGSSAALASGKQVFHGDVLHVDATPATGYYITGGTGDIKVEGNAIDQVKGTVTINPQVARKQYTFRFEPRLATAVEDNGSQGEHPILEYSPITDTSLKLSIPFGYDDNTQPTTTNIAISAVTGSITVLYNGYLYFPSSYPTDDSPVFDFYPEVKETNRIMYNFYNTDDFYGYDGCDRIGASDKIKPVYFYKMVGTILIAPSSQPIPLYVETLNRIRMSPLNSTDISSSAYTVAPGDGVVLWSDLYNGYNNSIQHGTVYFARIPSNQCDYYTFDANGAPDGATSKKINIASWEYETGFNESDIPTTSTLPTVYQKLYNVSINVESSKNNVILDNADVQAGYLFYCINDSEWHTFSGAASASLELPYGTTIKLAKNHNSNMTGFTYNSDTVSETKTITVNGTNYSVDIYSKSYTVNANNMNIPFYVTPNSYTITCKIGMGISSYNFSTTSKYGPSFSNQSYSSSKSFGVYYKDTCSYNGVVKTGFESPTPSASNETVSTKTITFKASPKKFRVTVSAVGDVAIGISATFKRTSSPYEHAATGNLTSGYDDSGDPVGAGNAVVFRNGYSFDAYYGDVFECSPRYAFITPTSASWVIGEKYIDFTSSRTITADTTWRIVPKQSNVTVYLTNTKFFKSDSQYIKYCRNGKYINSSTFSAGTEKSITIDAGTPIYMYTGCKANLNPGNTSCAVHTLGSDNPGVYVGTCYSQYSTSLTMSSFSKITALTNSNGNIEVVPAQTKESGDFYLTLAPIIKSFVRGYGIATTSASGPSYLESAYEVQYSGTTASGKYDCPHSETYSGSSSVTSYTTLITSTAVLRTETTEIETTWYCRSGVSNKVFYSISPASRTTTRTWISSVDNSDSVIPDEIVPTYGPYASMTVAPYLNVSYFSWGNKYALYYGGAKTFRTYRRTYDGTSNFPGIGYTATGTGAVSNLGTYTYYSGSTGSISSVSNYLSPGSGISMYDSLSTKLSRKTFLSSTNDKDPNKYNLSGAKFYAIFDFNSTSNKIESKLKAHLNNSLIIDYVYNYKTDNY